MLTADTKAAAAQAPQSLHEQPLAGSIAIMISSMTEQKERVRAPELVPPLAVPPDFWPALGCWPSQAWAPWSRLVGLPPRQSALSPGAPLEVSSVRLLRPALKMRMLNFMPKESGGAGRWCRPACRTGIVRAMN